MSFNLPFISLVLIILILSIVAAIGFAYWIIKLDEDK